MKVNPLAKKNEITIYNTIGPNQENITIAYKKGMTAGDIKIVDDWLRNAEDNWRVLEDDGILMDDPRNDGQWLRPWRIALNRFAKQFRS